MVVGESDMRHAYRASVCVVGLLFVLSCGGGGGGGASPLQAFSGTWHYAGYLGELVPPSPAVVTSDFGEAVGDGAGGLSLTHRQNVNTTVGGVAFDTGLSYGLAPDGSFTWTLAPGATQPALGGVLSADGRLGLLHALTVPSVPSFRVLVRRAGTFSLSSLSGDYHTLSVSFLPPSDASYVGTTTFTSGAVSSIGTTNREGLLQGSATTASYTVSAEGDLVVSNSAIRLEGGILEGGDVAVVGGGTNTGESVNVRFYVRASTSASLVTFAGAYEMVFFVTSDQEYGHYGGRLVADGAGGWTGDLQGKVIGEVVDVPDFLESGSYTVAPDGTFTIKFAPSATAYTGGVSADGAFAVAGGPLVGGEDPKIWVLVRR